MKGTILGFHSIVEGDVRSGLSAKELSMPTAVLLKFSIFGGTHVRRIWPVITSDIYIWSKKKYKTEIE
jgi:hypothetical protein